jgi:hypothetical protein
MFPVDVDSEKCLGFYNSGQKDLMNILGGKYLGNYETFPRPHYISTDIFKKYKQFAIFSDWIKYPIYCSEAIYYAALTTYMNYDIGIQIAELIWSLTHGIRVFAFICNTYINYKTGKLSKVSNNENIRLSKYFHSILNRTLGQDIEAMMFALEIKYEIPEYRTFLLNTNDLYLQNHAPQNGRCPVWSDACDGSGKNILGACLMLVREIIRKKEKLPSTKWSERLGHYKLMSCNDSGKWWIYTDFYNQAQSWSELSKKEYGFEIGDKWKSIVTKSAKILEDFRLYLDKTLSNVQHDFLNSRLSSDEQLYQINLIYQNFITEKENPIFIENYDELFPINSNLTEIKKTIKMPHWKKKLSIIK